MKPEDSDKPGSTKDHVPPTTDKPYVAPGKSSHSGTAIFKTGLKHPKDPPS